MKRFGFRVALWSASTRSHCSGCPSSRRVKTHRKLPETQRSSWRLRSGVFARARAKLFCVRSEIKSNESLLSAVKLENKTTKESGKTRAVRRRSVKWVKVVKLSPSRSRRIQTAETERTFKFGHFVVRILKNFTLESRRKTTSMDVKLGRTALFTCAKSSILRRRKASDVNVGIRSINSALFYVEGKKVHNAWSEMK